MLRSLHRSLIALVAMAPLFSGLLLAATAPDRQPCVRSSNPAPFEGSREDDAGTLVEQFEEDDLEQEQGRSPFVPTASAMPPVSDALGQRVGGPAAGLPRVPRSRMHLSRGPPTGR